MPAGMYEDRMTQDLKVPQNDQPSLASRCCQLTEESIRANPMAATMAAFGVGLGLGAVVGMLLAEPPSRSRRQTAEALGRRMLDSISDSLPDSVRRYVS